MSAFSSMEQLYPAGLLRILLIRAGVELNPGPTTWYCSVCKCILRRNQTSVKCNTCKEWCHLRPCSGLQSHTQWTNTFTSQCCSNIISPTTNSVNANTYNDQPPPLVIMQFNCRGLRNKIFEIAHFMHNNNIKIAAIQETKLNENVSLCLPDFDIIRKDRDRNNGGGLAFIIHKDIKYHTCTLPLPLATDDTLEQLAITIRSGNNAVSLVNLYIPPTACCPAGYTLNIQHLLQLKDSLIIGDLNAHHRTWYSALGDDARGIDLIDQIDTSDFGILNENSPTRITSSCISSPDISLASSELLTCTNWSTKPALNSDHVPVLISLERIIQVNKELSSHNNYLNFAKADWEGFEQHIEGKIDKVSLPRDVHKGEKTLRGILNKAAHRFIPAGKHHEIRPNFPTNAAKLADERDDLRRVNPQDPRIHTLSKEIQQQVNDHVRKKWRDHLHNCSFKPGAKNLWHTIKKLSNHQSQKGQIVISFNGKPTPDSKKCASEFNRQFTPHPAELDKTIRNTMRNIHNLKTVEPTQFSTDEVFEVIMSTSNSKALGPDNLSPIMLKHIGPKCVKYITTLFNLCMEKLIIPDIWKVSKVIPLLKPGKPADSSKSYRPISLLSPVIKLFEALILSLLKENLELADHQHGFRKNRSTTTALHHITDFIQNGLNERRPNKRTILVALDLSRAFDTVSHSILLKDILESKLPNDIKRWLSIYLRGRQTFVEYKGKKSPFRKVKQGVPQGGITSPILFNFYVSKLPEPPENIKLIT